MGDGRVNRAIEQGKARTSEIKERVPELKERVPELKARGAEELRDRGHRAARSQGTELRSRGVSSRAITPSSTSRGRAAATPAPRARRCSASASGR